MLERHCADTRYVWNLALEQFNWGRLGRSGPGPAARQKQLAEARQAFDWLAAGSPVQQQALRDFDRAVAGFFDGISRRPTWRRKRLNERFSIRDSRVRIVNRKWDRGVATTLALSDGSMLRAPIMRRGEHNRLVKLQQQLARCRKGSRRRAKLKSRIARLHGRVADRRRDWIEKTTTAITATYGVIAVEKLSVRNMVRAPEPKPDPDQPGHFLANGAAAKAGLSRKIYANCWGLIAKRLQHKTTAAGTVLVKVPAAYSSLECRNCGHISTENRKSQAEFECVACGHQDHADIQAAATILARATAPALTPDPGATPADAGVLAQARRPDDAQAA
jgi:transposase